jgi:hypothetical protein
MSAPRARKSKRPPDLSAAQAPALLPSQHPEHVSSLSSTKDVRLAEYKALRDESLRCAQLFANAVWVAVTGYAVTVGVGASFLGKAGGNGRQVREDLLLTAVLCLLCIEALAISTMYLSELWKYIRIGTYIRQYIEPQLSEVQLDRPPMNWERWIKKHRAKELYIGALTLLQLPVIVAAAGGLAGKVMSWSAPSPAPRGSVAEFIGWLTSDRLLGWCLAVIVALDVFVVMWLGTRVMLAERGTFDPPTSPAGWRALCRADR